MFLYQQKLSFWPELPKISIFFEILTSNDMQSDASNLLQFLLKCKEIVETRSKSWLFGSFWEVIFVYSPLTPYELHPNILANEELNCPFISIAFLFANLEIFKVFRSDSGAMKWSLLGGFWPLLPQILFDLAETLLRGSLLIRQTKCSKNPSKF